MYLKKHNNKKTEILALCDEDLLGKTFVEKELKLEIQKHFFKGKKIKKKEALEELQKTRNATLIGKKAITLALHSGIVTKNQIFYIKKIPFILIFEL